MNRKERIQLVRRLMWDDSHVSLPQIAKLSGVSLRTTYRDLHSILSKPPTESPAFMGQN
jgi:DeoR/GlpR family transcriptional regulator of sugar metabolism